jgi:hypothetical protein
VTTKKLTITLLSFFLTSTIWSEQMILDDFSESSNLQWDYLSDQVMGGVSQGKLQIVIKETQSYAQLSGEVSTENNGGFIQFRASLSDVDKSNIKGIYLKVRGNNQKYYVHLRTKGTLLPWQYYQSEFDVQAQWELIKLPLDSFVASSGWLRKRIKSTSIKSMGIVAFGRDHKADVSVSEVGFY